MEESQVAFTLWFAEQLADFRDGYPRDISLALVAGDRRGGKTFDTYFCQIAALIEVPQIPSGLPSIGWTISRTFRQRDELDLLIHGFIPAGFYKAQKAPEHRFTFLHGSILRNLSADDPEGLRQGRVDWLLYNEVQAMRPKAVKNGLYGTADVGGLCILAANPPSGPEGEWLHDLKDGIEEDEELGKIARFFNFSSKQNTKIDQPARKRVERLAAIIDPEGAESDAEGVWQRWGPKAYPEFNPRPVSKGGMVGPVPELGMVNITRVVTERHFWAPYPKACGGDFQKKPHESGAVCEIYEGPDGLPIYWFTDEILAKGNEEVLSTQAYAQGYVPDEMVWIADCSGSYQGAERIPGRTSYNVLEGQGWRVYPAEIIKIPEKSDHPRNPDVGQRLVLMMMVMRAGRLRVDPRCTWLIKSFTKCEVRATDYGKRVPKGRFAHITDGASYLVWRLEPKPDDIRDWSLDGYGPVKLSRKGSPYPTKRR